MKYFLRCLLILMAIKLQTGKAAAQAYIYFKADTIPGTSTVLTPDKKKLVDVSAMNIGAENTLNIGSGSGGTGAGKASAAFLTINLKGYNELQQFKKLFFSGYVIPSCYIIFTRTADSISTKNDYYVVALGTVKIAAVTETSSDGEPPAVTVSLAYGSAAYYYRGMSASGVPIITPNQTGWNFITNATTPIVALPSKY